MLWFVITPVWAQAFNEYTELSLDELMNVNISTSASLLPTHRNEAPGTVYTFDRADFSRLGIRRLEQLLRFVPGFQLNQYRKRHTSIWARGLIDRDNNKMVLLVDGVPLRRIYYGQLSLGDSFPLELVEKIEIVLGPASSLYGANAFGGIISITTRAQSDSAIHEWSLETAHHQRLKTSLWSGTQNTRVFASHLTQQAPFSEPRHAFNGDPTGQPLDEQMSSLYLRQQLSEHLSFTLDLQRGESPFLFIPPTQDAFVRKRSIAASLHFNRGTLTTGRTEAQLYYLDDQGDEREIEALSNRLGYLEHQQADMLGASLRQSQEWGDHILLAGLEWERERAGNLAYTRWFHYRDGFLTPPEQGYLTSDPAFNKDRSALYLQDVWHLNPQTTLTLGARQDHYDAFGSHFNYRGALVHQPNPQETWKLLYGTAIRTPSYREYMKVLEGTDFIPPALEPERITSLEIAYLRQVGPFELSATLFHNRLEQYIRETPTPDEADEYFANSDLPWTIKGMELLTEYHPSPRLYLRASASWLDVEWDQAGEPPYLARYSANLAVDYRYQTTHHAGLSVTYNSARAETNFFDEDTPGSFYLLNLHAQGQLSRRVHYQAGVDNLLDRRIYDPAGDFGWMHNTEQRRREIWARLTWSF